jgi:membrane protease YdiL (CAAX protease family)
MYLYSRKRRGVIDSTTNQSDSQYSLAKIIGIWAIVALPMPVVMFVIAPALIEHVNMRPSIFIWLLIICGYIWQFVVSLWIVYHELGTIRWTAIRERTWLNMPRDPNTGESKAKLFWWLIPAAVFVLIIELGIGDFIDSTFAWLFPFLTRVPTSIDFDQMIVPEFIGAWWLLGLALLNFVFNYFLGEEFLFRGVLLPKMKGVFGKWDWVANAVLFGLAHLDSPLRIPKVMLSTLAYTWTSRRFRSNWFAIILHAVEGLFVIAVVVAVVTGLAF